MVQCPRCKNEVQDDALFCTHCGMKIEIKSTRKLEEKAVVDRDLTLNILQEKCGFSFQEDNLPPETISDIGSLTKTLKQINQLNTENPNMKKSVRNLRDLYRIVKLIGISSLLIGLIYFLSSILGGISYSLTVAPYFLTFLSFGIIVWISSIVMNKTLYEPRYIKYVDASETYNDLRKKEKELSEKICEEVTEIYEKKARPKKAELKIDFSTILQAVGAVSNTIQNFKCKNCGAPVALPYSGSSVRCNYCGEIIEAVDVLKKVKDSLNLKE